MAQPTRRATITGLALALAAPAMVLARQPASGVLDGADFEGVLAPVDGGRPFEDTLHFRNGFYWSRGCIACSFAPGAYWTRGLEGAVSFTGTLESPERGVFRYDGLVRGDTIEIDVMWRRVRWYWTLERGFRFTGARLAQPPDMTLDQAFDRSGQPRAPGCTI